MPVITSAMLGVCLIRMDSVEASRRLIDVFLDCAHHAPGAARAISPWLGAALESAGRQQELQRVLRALPEAP